MNERVANGKTPEERLAAVARTLASNMHHRNGRAPDYADFRDTLKPFIDREILLARVDEARSSGSYHITGRVRELTRELMKIELQCDDVLTEL